LVINKINHFIDSSRVYDDGEENERTSGVYVTIPLSIS
jgi:hypothetical protein